MDYKGYKLLDKIMLVCRDKAEHEVNNRYYTVRKDYQAYLVDPSNKKQLNTARSWAEWTEYGPSHKNDETGKWEHEYIIKHEPVEFEFDNNGFELELLDCAGGSSQGGKLSFWNCFVTKDDNRFIIGINSDMLLNLLQNATFVNGKCQSPLLFITQSGKVGMTVKDSETYKQCIKDRELKDTLKTKAVSKYSFGDIVSTATISDIYLGTITQYYEFSSSALNDWDKTFSLRNCTITKLKKPITYYLFESAFENETLTDILNEIDSSRYYFPNLKKTCPKRAITGKINMDRTEQEFKQSAMEKWYNFETFSEQMRSSYYYKDCSLDKMFYYFLGRETFGYGFEPFELDSKLMEMIKEAGIKYIEQ
jgi:hypothetical protein